MVLTEAPAEAQSVLTEGLFSKESTLTPRAEAEEGSFVKARDDAAADGEDESTSFKVKRRALT